LPRPVSAADATTHDPERVRGLLRAKLEQLAGEESSMFEASLEPTAPVQYGKRAGDHVAESADRLARSRAAGELERLEEEVRAALEKLEAGTYGVCDDCQRPIPQARLEVLPWATRCVACQSARRR
jgi:DnaK suppressor protein